MRRLVLLCLAGLLMTAAVAVASPLIVRPAASRWFAAVRHTNSKSARRRVTHGKGHSRVFRTGRAGLASATSVAVLFGEQTVEPGHGEDFAGRAEAFPFTNSSTGSASSITVYLGYQNRAKALIAGIYADTKGHPGALVASGSLASPKAGTWNSVPIHSVAVTPGTYWVAVLGEGGSIHFRDRSGGVCASQRAGSGDLAALPSSWEAGATQTGCPISAYVVGTLSPSATTTTTTTQTDPTTTTTQTDPAVVTLPPLNTGAPTISGSTVAGDTLTATNGSWANSPTSYGYQWQDCTTGSLGLLCSDISGATGSSYTLANSDVGDTVRVVVTASNAGGSTSAPSAQSGVVTLPPAPANTAAPVVTGSPVEGQTLWSSPGTWSNSPTSYAYAWEDCDSSGNNCTTISGASSSTYTLASSDVGHTIRSIVTATNAGGKTSASSAQTAEVTIPAPGNTGLPAITGQTVQGQTLTTSNGTWTGSPTTYAYAWEDCDTSGNNCTTINGATTSTYTLTSSDVGNTIRSIVTATNTGGSTPATSNPSSTVTSPTPPPANTTAPAITGQTVQGQTLTTSNGTWTGSPTTYAYAWEDCDTSGNNCTTINGATTSTYTLTSSDVGNTIRSIVTATNTGGSTPATSTQTTAVTTNTTSGSGVFSVSGDEIVAPNGSNFVPTGANVNGQGFVWPDSIMNSSQTGCLEDSAGNCYISDWGWNTIRVNNCISSGGCPGYGINDNPAPYLANVIKVYTAMHIVVIVSVHDFTGGDPSNSGDAISGSDLTNLISFWTNMADTYKNNPYVWFNIVNEPTTASDSSSVWYNDVIGSIQAIRNAGANNIIVLDGGNYGQDTILICPSSGTTGSPYNWSSSVTAAEDPTLESTYGNIVPSVHVYQYWGGGNNNPGPTGESPQCTQSELNARLEAYVSYIHSLGLPLIMGETGDQPNPADDSGNTNGQYYGTVAAFDAANDTSLSPRVGPLLWHSSDTQGDCFVGTATTCAANGSRGWQDINSPTNPTNLTTFGQDLWNLTHPG